MMFKQMKREDCSYTSESLRMNYFSQHPYLHPDIAQWNKNTKYNDVQNGMHVYAFT